MKTIQNRKIGNFPFCWQDKTILRFLANTYKEHPKKLRTARSIYLALTELASNQGEESTFNAYRNQIGQLSGSSASTVDRYVKDFISFLILSKENRKKDLINLSNSWNLLAPISPTGYSVPASGDTPKQDSSGSSNQDSSEVIEEVNRSIFEPCVCGKTRTGIVFRRY